MARGGATLAVVGAGVGGFSQKPLDHTEHRFGLPPLAVLPLVADDVVQEVLTTVVQELPGFRNARQQGAFRAWLRRIAVNRMRTFWRGRRRHAPGTLEQAQRLHDRWRFLAVRPGIVRIGLRDL